MLDVSGVKDEVLWKISVRTTAEAADAVTELLQTLFSLHASSYADADSGEVAVSVFLSRKPGRFRAALLAGLHRIKGFGLDTGAGAISLRRLRRQNWAESWKRHFQPLEFGSRLLIKPSWSKRRPKKAQALVVLDPGLSFGTGRHPTTAFCLQQLVRHRDPERRQSFLDVGTGSGILALAAAKLGYAPVEAIDLDREAVRTARVNARRNRVQERVRFRRADLARLPSQGARTYDIVCANLISILLISERGRLVSRLKPDGLLVLAGILNAEFGAVARAYEKGGFKLVASRAGKQWRSGAFAIAGSCFE